MKKKSEVIAAIPIFNGLPADQIAAIEQVAVEKHISKGAIIFSEGEAGTGFYVIAEGRVIFSPMGHIVAINA